MLRYVVQSTIPHLPLQEPLYTPPFIQLLPGPRRCQLLPVQSRLHSGHGTIPGSTYIHTRQGRLPAFSQWKGCIIINPPQCREYKIPLSLPFLNFKPNHYITTPHHSSAHLPTLPAPLHIQTFEARFPRVKWPTQRVTESSSMTPVSSTLMQAFMSGIWVLHPTNSSTADTVCYGEIKSTLNNQGNYSVSSYTFLFPKILVGFMKTNRAFGVNRI